MGSYKGSFKGPFKEIYRDSIRVKGLLGGSWVAISEGISKLTANMTHIRALVTTPKPYRALKGTLLIT